MPGFQTLPADSMTWTQNVLGAEVTRLYTDGAVLTVVRGHKGDLVPAHGYTHGSVTYVVSGRLDIDGHVLSAGDGGSYRPGGGYFAVRAADGFPQPPQLAAQSSTVHGWTLTHRTPRRTRFGTFSPERGLHTKMTTATTETEY